MVQAAVTRIDHRHCCAWAADLPTPIPGAQEYAQLPMSVSEVLMQRQQSLYIDQLIQKSNSIIHTVQVERLRASASYAYSTCPTP